MRRHAADVGQAVAQGSDDAADGGDVAGAVLEADQVRALLAEAGQRGGGEAEVGAIVDDYANIHRVAHRLDVGREPGLAGLGQIVRQQQKAVGAGLLDRAGEVDRHGGAVAAAGEDRHLAGSGLGGPDSVDYLLGPEREELAGAAGGEEAGGGVLGEPLDVSGVGFRREAVAAVEGGDGEGEEAGADLLLKVAGGHVIAPSVSEARDCTRACRL